MVQKFETTRIIILLIIIIIIISTRKRKHPSLNTKHAVKKNENKSLVVAETTKLQMIREPLFFAHFHPLTDRFGCGTCYLATKFSTAADEGVMQITANNGPHRNYSVDAHVVLKCLL